MTTEIHTALPSVQDENFLGPVVCAAWLEGTLHKWVGALGRPGRLLWMEVPN